jgi:tetratricopeptide (TPR) repeat protein
VLKDNARLHVRMRIHSGPVSGVVDVNERANVAGASINIAQRVMDCGDAGHILLSHHVAEDLENYERWRPFLHDIGTFEVKHGVRVNVTNLYSDDAGNPNLPSKLQAINQAIKKHRAHVRWAEVGGALLLLGAIIAAVFFLVRRPTPPISRVLDKSIAVLPFDNLSSDQENAYFNRGIFYSNEKGDYDKAISDHNEAIRLDPKNANAYINRGLTYEDKGDYDKAISDHNEAIRLDPKKVGAYFNRGLAYQAKGDYNKAIADYTK